MSYTDRQSAMLEALRELRKVPTGKKTAEINRAISILDESSKSSAKTNFTMVLRPDGKAVLLAETGVDVETLQNLSVAFKRWRDTANDILVIGHTRLVTVMDIKLDMPQGAKGS
jgi:Fe-S cluster assembly ATPase SufC